MKQLPWKKIGLAGIGVAVVLVSIFYFIVGKSTKPYSTSINPAYAAYISSYTTGVISQKRGVS